MNKIYLIGNSTKDVELGTTTNGKDYAKFSLAVQRKFKNANGEKDTDFFNCQAWGKLASDVIGKYVKKGSKIAIVGSIESRKSEDGTKLFWNVNVEDVELLGKKLEEETQTEAPTLTEDTNNDGKLPF